MPTRPLVNLRVLRSARAVSPNYRTSLETSDDTTIQAGTDPAAGFSGIVAGNRYDAGDDTTIQAGTDSSDVPDAFSATADPNLSVGGTRTDVEDFIESLIEEEASIDFESAEEIYVAVGEPTLKFPARIEEVDESGFIVKGDVIHFTNAVVIPNSPGALQLDRKIYVLKYVFEADRLDDTNFTADNTINDYSSLFDGSDVSYSTLGNLTYDEGERSALEKKFSRPDRTNAVYNNLLDSDFTNSRLLEPPVVQTIQPEPPTLDSFSFLSNVSSGNLQLQDSVISPSTAAGPGSFSSGGGYRS